MTGLKPNGWRVNSDGDNVIELVRRIDEGQFSQEVIRAEKSIRTGIWSLDIYEADIGQTTRNEVKSVTQPTGDRDSIVATINQYTRDNPGDTY